jgi:hypothetical protein
VHNNHREQPVTAKGKGMFSHESSENNAVSFFVPKVPYPESEDDLYDILEDRGIQIDPDHDGNFFQQMEASDWTIRGEPVFDWIAAYQARLEVTAPC